ncbi:fimbrial biogenesis outer membrane usher protein [Serratia fonticola]|uniref:fimbria/pilus outer membrane usher protein n=1 Tax=Serratia fonticola TaxID=47917 RepID=UPI001647D1E4|nr:fimbria/pilus outer membrane usher protein [Serratia fonticola]MBC3252322.1 fimbrial biogenesis outer membrane usher protein [Serratia fonticola]
MKTINAAARMSTRRTPTSVNSLTGLPACFRLRPVLILLVLTGSCGPLQAKDYFNPAFLDDGSGQAVDLSAYETAGGVAEGSYLVDIWMNGKQASTRQVRFSKVADGSVIPELTPTMLKGMGVAVDKIETLKKLPVDKPVGDVKAVIPGATVEFSMAKLRLDLTVPQVDMLEQADGTVDPSLWDEGVPAMMFSYMMSGSRTTMDGQYGMDDSTSDSLFGTVNGGVNLGAWRLRSTMTASQYKNRGNGNDTTTSTTDFSNTYLQRDIQRLRASLRAGESSTGGTVFDSVPFRGVQLTSDDSMEPSSKRGFAPVVTGIASTTARVSVRQNGSLIYETTVPPGPFRLTDLYNAGSGELQVTVTEADGTQHVSTQNISTLSVMKRPGAVEYEVTAGRYSGNNGTFVGSHDPLFALATATVGLPWNMTAYGGLLAAQKYQSLAMGLAVSLGVIGAVSLDSTLAHANVETEGEPDETKNGAAFRAQYAKTVDETGTTVNVAAWRYATRDFMTFQDAVTNGYSLQDGQAPWLAERRRSSWQANLSQSLGSIGSVFLRASRDDYWNSDRVVNTVGAGFSSSIKGVSYSLNYNEDHTRATDDSWPVNRQASLNLSVPFSLFDPKWESVRNMNANYSITNDNHGRTSQQAGLSGSLVDNKLSWSASQGHDNQGGGTNGNLSTNWSGSRGSVGVGYGYGPNTKTYNASANGGLVVHQHGVTFTNMLGDAMALVEAPGAGGLKVGSTTTDSRGYAVVPYLQTYQRNQLMPDTTTLPDGVEMQDTSATVYPTRGALVVAKLRTRVGRQAMLTLNFGGQPVPFGALAALPEEDVDNASIVGDGGMLYLTGAPQKGTLQVKWGNGPDQQCKVNYDLGELITADKTSTNTPGMNIVQQTLDCQPVAGVSAPLPATPELAATGTSGGGATMATTATTANTDTKISAE